MSIYQRIGEAIASQGKITVVAALTFEDEEVLRTSGFKKIGTMDLNGVNVDLYEVKLNTVSAKSNVLTPRVYVSDDKSNRRYDQQWPDQNYRMTLDGKGGYATAVDQYRQDMQHAYSPLSILEDYFFPNENSQTYRVHKIDLSGMSSDNALAVVNQAKRDFHEKHAKQPHTGKGHNW